MFPNWDTVLFSSDSIQAATLDIKMSVLLKLIFPAKLQAIKQHKTFSGGMCFRPGKPPSGHCKSTHACLGMPVLLKETPWPWLSLKFYNENIAKTRHSLKQTLEDVIGYNDSGFSSAPCVYTVTLHNPPMTWFSAVAVSYLWTPHALPPPPCPGSGEWELIPGQCLLSHTSIQLNSG